MGWLRARQGPQKISHFEEAFVGPFRAAFKPPAAPELPELRKRLSLEHNRILDRFLRLQTLDDIHRVVGDVLPALEAALREECPKEVSRRAMQRGKTDYYQVLGSIVNGNLKRSVRIAQRAAGNLTRKGNIAPEN
jgi:hypothetical protein